METCCFENGAMVEPLRHHQTKGRQQICSPRHISTLPKAYVTCLESRVCTTPESRHHPSSSSSGSSINPFAVLRDRHVDAGAPLGVDQFDGLRHRVGIFPAMVQRFEAKVGPDQVGILRDVLPASSLRSRMVTIKSFCVITDCQSAMPMFSTTSTPIGPVRRR